MPTRLQRSSRRIGRPISLRRGRQSIIDNDRDGTGRDNRIDNPRAKHPPFISIAKLRMLKTIAANQRQWLHGTGFVIAPGVLLTAAHNLFRHSHAVPKAEKVILAFENQRGGELSVPDAALPTQWTDDNDRRFDFAVIANPAIRQWSNPLKICPAHAEQHLGHGVAVAGYDDVRMIGRQAIHRANIERISGGFVFHRVDTEPGQSGSPILSSSNAVIGMHLYKAGVFSTIPGSSEDTNVGIALTPDIMNRIQALIHAQRSIA